MNLGDRYLLYQLVYEIIADTNNEDHDDFFAHQPLEYLLHGSAQIIFNDQIKEPIRVNVDFSLKKINIFIDDNAKFVVFSTDEGIKMYAIIEHEGYTQKKVILSKSRYHKFQSLINAIRKDKTMSEILLHD